MEAADPALAPISEKITGVTVALEPSELLAAEPTVLTNISIGYARVSTDGQKLERRLDALKAAGCRRTFAEKQSVRDTDRPELTACLEFMAAGDTLVVPSLDRLSRSPAGPDHHDRRPAPARHRVYLTAREPRHHHPGWPAGVPRLRRPGRVHPRADRLRHPRGPGRRPRPRPRRRAAHRRHTRDHPRRTSSRSRGLVFYRVLELAVGHDPVPYQALVADPKHKGKPPAAPVQRGHPPSTERPRVARLWRTAHLA